MKSFILVVMTLFSLQSVAEDRLCRVSNKTLNVVEKLRNFDLPFEAVQNEMIQVLTSDKCLNASLTEEEINLLSLKLLPYEDREDSASKTVNQFLGR